MDQPEIILPPTPPETIVDGDDLKELPSSLLPPPSRTPTEVLEVDRQTPDAHVPRDPRLIRLTGVHPFNVEAPLTELFKEGFLTSSELFYVRNHGAVPFVHDEDILQWEFSVEGLVAKPLRVTLKELLDEYENVTYPITLVCAGNRRKEQNMVRKTKGFSWGPAGVSTALFTGVAMRDVIARAQPLRGAKYVCMEGADKLPNGYYGTSIKLDWVMDPNRGIMLAHKMNGEPLQPDHGKPLRAVIPGQIGGRSVKWLKKIIITAKPSDNWYHIYDNRVLPTMVDPDEASKKSAWWTDERYAIYDLSPNSAIAYPAHDERIELTAQSDSYQVKGYAYSGGGRRITRVEASLDQGKSWQLANIDYAEDQYRAFEHTQLFGGRLDMEWREASFCWCFWKLDIGVSDLKDAKDVVVRAMDESMNVQPRDMYWSVLGMMNNSWFRVVVHHERGGLRFEHPAQPALMPGGWMERVKKSGGNLTNGSWGMKIEGEAAASVALEAPKEIKMIKEGVDRVVSIEELRKHANAEDPWFVLDGEVYDGTAFLNEHPGGAQSIISAAGVDSTDDFMAIHSETAKAMMPTYHIGTLDSSSRHLLSHEETEPGPSSPRSVFLDPRSWRKAILQSKRTISWDTRIFTFKLDHAEQSLGLPTGQHIMLRLRDSVTREAIIRSYTPISQAAQKGYCDILVKLYFDAPERAGGKMSKTLDTIPIGHFVEIKGPIGEFEYLGRGVCTINNRTRYVQHFNMICAGSGITPIFQVLRAVMQDTEDTATCTVIDGNRLTEDILCKEDLDQFARENIDRCKVVYTLTQAPEAWQGRRGRIDKPLLEEYCAQPDDDSFVLVCGPGGMERSVKSALTEKGWKEENMVFF